MCGARRLASYFIVSMQGSEMLLGRCTIENARCVRQTWRNANSLSDCRNTGGDQSGSESQLNTDYKTVTLQHIVLCIV